MNVRQLIEALQKVEDWDARVEFTYDSRCCDREVSVVDLQTAPARYVKENTVFLRGEDEDDYEYHCPRKPRDQFIKDTTERMFKENNPDDLDSFWYKHRYNRNQIIEYRDRRILESIKVYDKHVEETKDIKSLFLEWEHDANSESK